MSEPKVVITITASDYYGTVEARREVRAALSTAASLREQIAKSAADAASHASDLMDTHIAAIDRQLKVAKA